MDKTKRDYSYGARYLLMYLSSKVVPLENRIDDISYEQMAKESGISLRCVYGYSDELVSKGAIGKERNPVFGKGRGVNGYILFERVDHNLCHIELIREVIHRFNLKIIEKIILINLLNRADEWGVVESLNFNEFAKACHISGRALKENVARLVESEAIFSLMGVGHIELFGKNIDPNVYLNLSKYENPQIKFMFNRRFEFCTLEPNTHFHMDGLCEPEVKEYFSYLEAEQRSSLILFLTSIVDDLISDSLNKLNEENIKAIKSELEKDVIEMAYGTTLISVNTEKLREKFDFMHRYLDLSQIVDCKFNSFIDAEDSWFTTEKELYKQLKKDLLFLAYSNSILAYIQSPHYQKRKFRVIREQNYLIKEAGRMKLPKTILTKTLA